jgi:hypothetical protein
VDQFSHRASLLAELSGRWATVVYRDAVGLHEVVGQIIGASWHVTNGNSTGDLVIDSARLGLCSVSLARVVRVVAEAVLS